MSSSSDSEDDTNLRKFMEAADPALLTNEMYQNKSKELNKSEIYITMPQNAEITNTPKSQRQQLIEDAQKNDFSINLSKNMQDHFYKKISDLISKNIEFCDIPKCESSTKCKKFKSKVQLLKGEKCYLKPEQFYDEIKGPTKKPEIKRRMIDEENDIQSSDRLQSAVVTYDFIESGSDLKHWAKSQKEAKIFKYIKENGTLHLQENENEFSKLRRKNKWNEAKIKKPKNSFR